jgi:hypothetical protein
MNDTRIPKLMCEYTPKWPTKHKSDHVEPSEARTGLMGGPAGTWPGRKPITDHETSLE